MAKPQRPNLPLAQVPAQPGRRVLNVQEILRQAAVGFKLQFHARSNAKWPGCCEIWLADQFCARISAPGGTDIYQNATGLRHGAPGGEALEAAYLIGVLQGLELPKPIRMSREQIMHES
jgi:hypothetical protein